MADLRVNYLLEFVTVQLPVEVLLVDKVVDVDTCLGVTGEKLSCLFDSLVKSENASRVLPWVFACLLQEFLSEFLHNLVV